jgi:hypothetical protein
MMKPATNKRWLLAALSIALIIRAAVAPLNVVAQEEVVQIRLANRHVDEMLPAAKPLLSSGGFISADQRSNSLIVIDNPDAIARIQRLVQELDQEMPLLIIRVQYANAASNHENEASAAARVEDGKITAEIGREPVRDEGVDIDAYTGRTTSQRQSEYLIRVRSGGSAYIEVGYDVPHRMRWQELSQRYGYVPETVVFQRVASGYNVRPVLAGDQVQIEIVPRINYFDNRGRDQNIHFAEAATALVVPLDKWIDISGVMGGHREVNRQILADSRHAADRGLTMRLMVSIDR